MTDKHDYGGMTVNERLFVAGLADAFNDAVARRDRAVMISILETVDARCTGRRRTRQPGVLWLPWLNATSRDEVVRVTFRDPT